ncbi:hypothetical protein ES703_01841 [subsurface metagenome]
MEIYEAPGWLDDCFRSGLWTLFQSAASQSLTPDPGVSGDLATMAVTEGASPTGCGYRKDISSEGLGTDTFPRLRVKLRGRGTTPQYKLGVEYTDASSNGTGWLDAPSEMTVDVLEFISGKTVKYVKLYARCNTAFGTAYVDWDYAVVVRNPPLVPVEVLGLEADLQTTTRVSGLKLRILNDVLLGVTARRYSLDEGEGGMAYDLSGGRGHADLVNTTWSTQGRFGGCLFFDGSDRMETGYKTVVGASEARTIAFWVKAPPGLSGVICGVGQTVGGGWSRIQLNWSSNRVRLYVRDDAGSVRQYTSTATVADNAWHHVVGVIDPSGDAVGLWVDGEYDGGASGALGQITVDLYDLTWGCLHNDGAYSNYSVEYVDEPTVLTRALDGAEIRGMYRRDPPPSGAARARVGSVVMVYLAHSSESLVYKLFTGRVIDRFTYGDPDEPVLELVCEDLGEVMHERTFTGEYAMATQISAIVDDVSDGSLPELFHEIDATNRAIANRFNLENVWSLLGKLAETVKFSTGETGANFYVDPGGALRFKRYGAFNCPLSVSDGSDGSPANILDVRVRETMKGQPRLVNDVRVVIFEEEALPRDEDSLTESAEGWSSPDPTDMGYPQSDSGDYQAGTASVRFNTTNPGAQYRMRCEYTELDVSGYDSLVFQMKYGAGLSVDSFEVRIWRGGWLWVTDYLEKTGISPQGSGAWHEYSVDLSGMSVTGNPGNIVKNLRIRAVHSAQIGTGGFLFDKLRFVRDEKYGSHGDALSQDEYGKRTLRVVDKSITDIDFADYVAENIVEHRRDPLVMVEATVPGRGQVGYRPPQMVVLTSLKDGVDGETFQIQRARHVYTPGEGYTCDLELVAARRPDGSYVAEVAPVMFDLAASIAEVRRAIRDRELNVLRTGWM